MSETSRVLALAAGFAGGLPVFVTPSVAGKVGRGADAAFARNSTQWSLPVSIKRSSAVAARWRRVVRNVTKAIVPHSFLSGRTCNERARGSDRLPGGVTEKRSTYAYSAGIRMCRAA
jgi:hypothetical protein